MKYLVTIIIAVIIVSLLAEHTEAATVAPTSKPSSSSATIDEKLNNQINQLKEKIASRVSELNLVEKHGVIGTVSETAANKVTLSDLQGKTRIIDVDELTKFASPSAKSAFGLSDLTKGTKITVLGLYNKQTKRILARYIDVTVTPHYLSGTIESIDKKSFTFVLIDDKQKKTTINVETTTKLSGYNKADGLTKLGFTKLEIGKRVIAVGHPDKKDPSLLNTSRVMVFPDLPTDPKIVVDQPAEASSSSELTPIPTATKKSPTKP